MSLTNFPHGIQAFPVVGATSMFGAQGSVYFVDAYAGNDANSGKSPVAAKKTVKAAYDLCADGKNDVVYLLADGTTGSGTADVLTAAITWSKHRTHLIGVCAPNILGQRCRINTTTVMTPMFTVSGRGCYIANIQFTNSGEDATGAAVCMLVTGDNNVFENCHFQGLNATAVADNSHRALKINSADDCYFKNCTIGATTVDGASAANCVIEFTASGAASNDVFDDCLILGNGAAGSFFIQAGAASTSGFTIFRRCLFANCTNGVQDAMTYAMDFSSGGNGTVLLYDSTIHGAADTANNPGNIFSNAPGVPAATDAKDMGVMQAVLKT